MDVRSKERLTGAIILVVIVVLVVPELLTGPRRASEPAMEESAEGAPMRVYTIDLTGGAGARPARPVTRPPAEMAGTDADALPPSDASDDGDASVDSDASPAGNAAREIAAASEAAGTADDAHDEDAQASRAVAQRGAQERASGGSGQAPRTAVSPPVTGWSIQVGSFANRENAERLAGELRRQDFDTFVVEGKTSGRTLYRVRVGPAGDRAAAQALAGRLASAGRPGSIVPHP